MPERFMLENAFFEHLGLAGGLLLVAWIDWQEIVHRRSMDLTVVRAR
jgi:hypothetical protein